MIEAIFYSNTGRILLHDLFADWAAVYAARPAGTVRIDTALPL